MRVIVTGNLGYVGTVMTPLLEAAGHEVWGLDTGYYRECLLGPLPASGVRRQVERDIRRVSARDIEGADALVHLAALSNDPTGELNPRLTEDINLAASKRLAEMARDSGISRFVFASSCSIYGQSDGLLDEESAFNPLTAYARSKVDTERALKDLANDDFSPVFLRNGTAYGFSPRLRVDIVVNNLTGWAVTTGEVKLMSDGRAWRPLVHVEDMTRAVIAALQVPRERVHNQAFNVGRAEDNHQIRTIAEEVQRVVPNSKVTFAEGVSADARNYNVSFDKIARLLPEFQPLWSVPLGVRELYAAYTAHGLDYDRFNGREFTRLKQLQYLTAERKLDDSLAWID